MFRPIYYLGCKASFTGPIVEAINRVDPSGGRACDLFAGTGAVGAALAKSRNVTAVDVQEYSRVLCSAQLNPPELDFEVHSRALSTSSRAARLLDCAAPLINFEGAAISKSLAGEHKDLVDLIESPPLVLEKQLTGNRALEKARAATRSALKKSGFWGSPDATITSYFGGTYFSFRQSVDLDAILSYAHSSKSEVKDALLAVSLSTASSIVNTVGKQFAQPIRPRAKSGSIKGSLGSAVSRDRHLDVGTYYATWLDRYSKLQTVAGRNEALKMTFEEALGSRKANFSVVYADPPYTRDHYSRFYHVLETMCLRDAPEISHVKRNAYAGPSRGAYRADRYQSPFCIRSAAPGALSELCRLVADIGVPLVLSYSPHEAGDGTHPRVLSVSDILRITQQFFRNVSVRLLDGSTHNQLNRSELMLAKRGAAEMIVECLP